MQRWDLKTPGESDRTGPRALFSTPEARGVVVELAQGETMGDHRVRERAIVQVLQGSVTVTAEPHTATCDEGTLIVFDPGEHHAMYAVTPSRLLLLLAPWPAPGHYDEAEAEDPHELPVNATQGPLA